jgi:perosamine synthetase
MTAGPDLSGNEKKYLQDAIDKWKEGRFGYYKERFTQMLQEYLGVKHVLLTNSGTGALHLGCMALGLQEGDEVITSEISYIASANAISYTGAKPVFCDIADDTWCIDENKIEELITSRTKAIMPVYIYGNMPDMTKILDIGRKYGLRIITDACPALGSEQRIRIHNRMITRKAGSIGDIECFSFQGAKMLTTGEGGCICTNDDFLWERINFFNNNCEVEGRKFYFAGIGHCYDMSNICAAMGVAQLERVNSFVDRKQEIFHKYYDGLGELFQMNKVRWHTKSNYWMSSLILPIGGNREVFMKKLAEKDIDTRPIFLPLSYFNIWNIGHSPIAERIGSMGVNLPSGLVMGDKELEYIINAIKEDYEQHNV